MPDRGVFITLAEAEVRDSSDPDDNLHSCVSRTVVSRISRRRARYGAPLMMARGLSPLRVRSKPSHGIPAKRAKMDASCANRERHLAFLPSWASLYCEEPDDAPAVARCFAGAFGREPKGEPR
jgi:hypothetical protein